MKARLWMFALVAVMVLSFCIACGQSKAPMSGSTEFVKSISSMTNGTLEYKRLPKNWRYRGKYPYRWGTVKGGNKLYASDEEGSFVQERKSWFQDMDYAPWMLSSIELPKMPVEDIDVHISRASCVISGAALDEFMEWYRTYAAEGTVLSDSSWTKTFAVIYFTLTSNPDLEYDCRLSLRDGIEGIEVLNDKSQVVNIIKPDTALYRQISDFRETW
ncbi:MAG: hypothetical protein IJR17_04420 [Clostridia bacterium]|nr:hypothetical protein [Clostridia bacterium]